jgi:hypothetical protein
MLVCAEQRGRSLRCFRRVESMTKREDDDGFET